MTDPRHALKVDANVFRSRVGRRTVLLFLFCAILPVSALAILAFGQVTTQLHEQSEKRLRQASKSEAMSIYERLLFLEGTLQMAASRVADGLPPVHGLDPRLHDRFRTLAVEELPALTEPERRHLQAGRTLLGTHRAPGSPVRIFLRRAVDPDRLQAGALVGEIEPAYLWGGGEEHTLPPLMELCVLGESGNIVFCSFEPPSTFTAKAKLPLARATQGQFEWSDDASDYLAAYWPLFLKAEFLGPTWTVVLSESKTDALAPLARFRRSFPLILLLSLGTVLLLSIGQIRRSLLPLQRLQQGARGVTTGAFDTRVEVTSRDEFADVAASFNTMADRLGLQFGVLTTRNEINGALNHGENLEAILRRCAETLEHRLGFARVEIWALDREQEALELQARAGTETPTDGPRPRVGVSQGGLGLIAQEGRPYVADGSFQDPRVPDPEWARREGMAAFVGQPLVTGAKVVGVIAAFARQPVDEVVLDGLTSAAGEIARYIERTRVADALRESGEQVRQLQKMEAVGRLAGGIAHDFNNLLTVISGHTQLLLRKLGDDDPLHQRVSVIDKTAGRAALLTKQLLAFSRKQVLVPSVLDLNDTVTGSAAILERLIGEHITLDFRPGEALGHVEADAGQLEQVIMNLVVNARDAMPDGGRITIETADVEVSEDQSLRRLGVKPGAYVVLSVSDTGIGMDADTRARIFEPFFTTKEPGKGTGLGLATVYGIVKQSQGGIVVESAPRQGTTFKIYLPRVQDAGPATATSGGLAAGGTETILLVEDEAEVLSLVEEMLKGLGYDVLAAAKVDEACLVAERHLAPIHLLLTDVVMPQLSGIALAQRLLARRPQMKVLYMSGYTEHPAVGRDAADLAPAFIQKPFTCEALGRKIRDLLDSAAS